VAIDFPTAPTLNQIYTYGSRSWQWNGTAWDIYSTAVGVVVTTLNGLSGGVTLAAGSNVTLTPVGNTITIASSGGGGTGVNTFTYGLTASPGSTQGDRWMASDTGIEYVYINDGNSQQWIQPTSSGSQGNTSGIPTDYVISFNGLTGGVTLAAGSNITLTPVGNTITIASLGGGSTASVFDADLIAAFGSGKFFGKYVQGDVIPAIGKTAVEVIKDALVAALSPTVSLTSLTTIPFNQTAISNVLNFSYVINSLGASVSGVTLDWRRNGIGSYTTLSTNTGITGFTHSLTDSAFNSQAFNYRYRVTDSVGATGEATLNITPTAYVAPTRTITLTGTNTSSPETSTSREKGNVTSTISAVITRNSPNVAITSWQRQVRENGGGFTGIESATGITANPSSISTGSVNHSTANTVSSAAYRIKVTDAYQDSIASSVTTDSSTINYYNYIFYGATASAPTTSANIRSLPSKALNISISNPSNPFILNTGSVYNDFTVALPSTLTLSSVFDIDASNANITTQYILNTGLTGIADYAGITSSYNVYTMSPAIAYTANHQHSVTRA
jgi:hypothetical protein